MKSGSSTSSPVLRASRCCGLYPPLHFQTWVGLRCVLDNCNPIPGQWRPIEDKEEVFGQGDEQGCYVKVEKKERPVVTWSKGIANSVPLIGRVGNDMKITYFDTAKLKCRLAVPKAVTETESPSRQTSKKSSGEALEQIFCKPQLRIQQSRQKGEEKTSEQLWQEFFSDPLQWWDNRFDKISPRSPDFRHRHTNEALWIQSQSNPPWVEAALTAMIHGQALYGDIMSLCKAGELTKALHILHTQGISADTNTYVCLLRGCIRIENLEMGKQVHAHIIQSGFKADIFLLNMLVNMYAKCGSVVDARLVLDKMPKRDVYTWTMMMAGYVKHGCNREALEIYQQTIREGVMPNKVTFICALKACASSGALQKGEEVHADIIKASIEPDIMLETSLAAMYAKCGNMKDAREVFDNMAQRDVVAWNVMIAAYAQQECGRAAFNIYEQMKHEAVKPDKATFLCILDACVRMAALEKGKDVHADIIKARIPLDIILETVLIDMYAKCGSMKDAHQVFDNMAQRDVVSWSAMIAGYAQQGYGMEAYEIYEQMIQSGVTPNEVTFTSVLNGCASLAALEKGKEVHGYIIKAGIGSHIKLENTLVNMYAKCGSVKDARQVFDKMSNRDVISWSTMIAGYAQYGCGVEALEMYEQMVQEGVTPDKVTFICILNACASLTALEKGKEVHADLIKAQIVPDTILETALVNMHAKCGNMNEARQMFDNMAESDVVSWNVMIAGYARHGCGREALKLFEQMQQHGLKPNSITFLGVFSACSHMGLVDEGCHYFDSMSQDHGFMPTEEHFGCLVDLFGRAGHVDDAEEFINKMPIEPGTAVWMALLGACRIHSNVEVAERIAKSLLTWNLQEAPTNVLTSNIRAA